MKIQAISFLRSTIALPLVAAVLAFMPTRAVAAAAATPVRKAALVVENRAGDQFKKQASLLEDLLLSRASGQGLTLLSRQVVTDAIAKEGPGASLDQLLGERSSALRLSQNLGVDFILFAALSSVGKESRTFNDGDLSVKSDVHTMRVSYKLIEAGEGGALAGSDIRVSRAMRGTQTAGQESTEIFNEMIDEAVAGLLKTFPAKVAQIAKTEVNKAALVEVSFATVPVDLTQQPLRLPDLQVGPDGKLVKGPEPVEVMLADATIEANGVVLGTTPATIKLPPGFNKIRITREGYRPVEQMINAMPGQKLRFTMQLSEPGYARWKDNVAFLQALEKDRKLTDAEVKAVEGFAKMLEQSGYKVDIKGKSLYDGANIQVKNKN
jgi:hypothetical protein